jgi:hypothetical protein
MQIVLYVSYLKALEHVCCAPLPAAAPGAVALALLDGDGADAADHGLVYKVVHECGDGRIQDKGDEEEESKDAHDACGAQDQRGVVLWERRRR